MNSGLHIVTDENASKLSVQTPVKVVSGTVELPQNDYDLIGKKVGYVRSNFAEALNIQGEEKALVAGGEVSDDYELRSGDELEFVRRAGEKG